jgi:hypothetical protein
MARLQAGLARVVGTGKYTIAELIRVFSGGRAAVNRTIEGLRTCA